MCHLILLLPLLALPLFWLMPPSAAIPAYGVVLIISGGAYYLAVRSMRQPVVTGTEALVNQPGEVVSNDGGVIRVRAGGDIWTAESSDTLQQGDRVKIVGITGLKLTVRHDEMHDRSENRTVTP